MGTLAEFKLKIIERRILRLELLINQLIEQKTQTRWRIAAERARNPYRKAAQYAIFCNEAREVYQIYARLRQKGFTHSEAIKAVRCETEILHDAVVLYVSEGRKLFKRDPLTLRNQSCDL